MPFKDPQKIKEYKKVYYQRLKEQKKEYCKEYRQTPNGIKSRRIIRWKERGVINDDFDKLYELYINTNNCNVCKKVFKNTKDRCLDHDHTNGQFRQILCHSCNIHDNWKNNPL